MEEQTALQQKSILDEVISGLRKPQKTLPSKLFYDERGSELFEQITRLDEYYLTRTELAILEDHISAIIDQVGRKAMLIELGSGSSRKTRLLLDQLDPGAVYLPVDISDEYLQEIVSQLREDYPELEIEPICADYTADFVVPGTRHREQRQVIFFPGSTIGNFDPKEARRFLEHIHRTTEDNAAVLVGIDLAKERSVLEAAYNDKKGVTARFNKNMLHRINRELDADFEIDNFAHRAFFNEREGRIEMHLVSEKEQSVEISGHLFRFSEGESIHTENSYKFSLEAFSELVSGGYRVEKTWTDANDFFAIVYLRKK
ncbi:MAG: L-histidine N(alpha)-methyltransferase [Balneolaceae bacterium]|nr:L-histidine N(alpha)-methyltransferase [Balneolaceae bacterium]